MARLLSDIMTELNTVYQPQRDTYNKRLGEQDPQLDAEMKGLQAQEQDSFQGITDQANRRGLFYSGIPVQEQQKYNATQYLPAIANLRGKYKASKDSLFETLQALNSKQQGEALGIRDREVAQDEEKRRWEAEMQFRRDEAARAAAESAAARAAAGSGGGGGFNFGGGGFTGETNAPQQQRAAAPQQNNALRQQAYNELKVMMDNRARDPQSFVRELKAINQSAGYGNQKDKLKLELMARGAFGPGTTSISSNMLANGGSLRF